MGTAANTPSPHSSHGTAMLDGEQLKQLRELPGHDGRTLLDELIEIVVRDVPPDLIRVKVMVQQRAGAELAQLAHRVAGSAASLGAVAFRQVLHELEQAGRKSDWTAADRVCATLDHEWEATRTALQQISVRPPP